jgi:hypothetical protein
MRVALVPDWYLLDEWLLQNGGDDLQLATTVRAVLEVDLKRRPA